MIGRTPVGWMQDLEYVYVIAFAFVLSILFRRKFDKLYLNFIRYDWFRCFYINWSGKKEYFASSDLYCIRDYDSCFGGVIRDILCNEIPVILERNLCYHLHTTWCYFFMLKKLQLNEDVLYLSHWL
jgi:uncharacterized membrane protein YeiH